MSRASRPPVIALLLLLLPLLLLPTLGARGYRELPWHLVEVWWDMGNPGPLPLEELTLELEVPEPPLPLPPGAPRLFLALLYWKVGDQPFYLGLQSDLHDPATKRWRGPGAIFSRWGGEAAGEARPAPGGYAALLTADRSGEGDFASVRLPLEWSRGRQTHTLRAGARDATGQWVGYTIHDHASSARIPVGALHFTAPTLELRGAPSSFVEYYGAQPPAPGNRPRGTVSLGGLLLNHTLAPRRARAIRPPDVPPLTRVEERGGRVVIRFGLPPGEADPERRRWLP